MRHARPLCLLLALAVPCASAEEHDSREDARDEDEVARLVEGIERRDRRLGALELSLGLLREKTVELIESLEDKEAELGQREVSLERIEDELERATEHADELEAELDEVADGAAEAERLALETEAL